MRRKILLTWLLGWLMVMPVLTMDDIGVGTASVGGDVTLEYKTTLK